MKRARIPAVKEPQLVWCGKMGKMCYLTIAHFPLVERQAMSLSAWNVKVPDYADFHVVNTATEAGAAANHAATNKNTKYSHAIQHSCVRSGGHWDRGYMAPSGGGTGTGDWKTDGQVGSTLQAMPGSPPSCSSSCPWHYRGGMRSQFKTRSPPASSLQSVTQPVSHIAVAYTALTTSAGKNDRNVVLSYSLGNICGH